MLATPVMRRTLRMILLFLALFYVLPVIVSATLYYARGRHSDWRSADRSSMHLLPSPRQERGAMVRIFSARTVSWRGVVASHSWVVIKDADAPSYERFDYVAWGGPIWKDRFVPDAKWFGSDPEVIFAADGERAARMIPAVRAAIRDYRYAHPGDYRIWPGPNSNTFVAAVMQKADMKAALPATAVGKDFPFDGRWLGWSPSKTGVRLNLGGYFGVTIGWYEGLEINVLGAVAGLDFRRPALKLPGLGRLGLSLNPTVSTSLQGVVK